MCRTHNQRLNQQKATPTQTVKDKPIKTLDNQTKLAGNDGEGDDHRRKVGKGTITSLGNERPGD